MTTPNISTVSPTDPIPGTEISPDYTTLATWEADADGEVNAAQHALCYAGDLEPVVIASWTGTPDVTDYPRVYTAPDNRHDGTATQANGARIDASGDSGAIQISENYTRIEGLRLVVDNCEGIDVPPGVSNCLIDGCNIVMINVVTANTNGIQMNHVSAADFEDTIRIINNVIYGEDPAAGGRGIYLYSGSIAAEDAGKTLKINAYLENNTVSKTGTFMTPYGGIVCRSFLSNSGNVATVDIVTLQNNVCTGNSIDFHYPISGGSTVTTSAPDDVDYNLSEDLTSDDKGTAENCVTGATAADVHVNVDTNLALKEGSDAIESGVNLFENDGMTQDAIEIPRQSTGAFDMGAFRFGYVATPVTTLMLLSVGK